MEKYYIYSGGVKNEVTWEVYKTIADTTNEIQYRKRLAEQCAATQHSVAHCEGDCCMCSHYVNRAACIDAPNMRNHIALASADNVESQVVCSQLLDIMQTIDPDGKKIGRLYLLGYKDADIARELGINRSTYHYRITKIRRYIKKYWGTV